MRIVVILLLLVVVGSLFSGLYFVYRDKGTTNRAVISLTIRIAVSLLVFGMSVFFVTSMASVVAAIPREKFDYARSLRMSEWRVVWEVVVLGTADQAIEVLRQNAAMGWMMLTMVEGISRSEGGVGAMLLNQNKHFHLAEVFAIQILILVLGMTQDYGIGVTKRLLCPYSALTLERQ